jgi:hypothetical protein
VGLLLAPVFILNWWGSRDSNPIVRGMFFIVVVVATPLLSRPWFSRRLRSEHVAVCNLLRRRGLEHDALTVTVVSEAISREAEPLD